nr:hypothetical protein Iba_chr14fCG2720 [Ipomoea batatas]
MVRFFPVWMLGFITSTCALQRLGPSRRGGAASLQIVLDGNNHLRPLSTQPPHGNRTGESSSLTCSHRPQYQLHYISLGHYLNVAAAIG